MRLRPATQNVKRYLVAVGVTIRDGSRAAWGRLRIPVVTMKENRRRVMFGRCKMMRFLKVTFWTVGILSLPFLVARFHLGPLGVRVGDDVLCADFQITNGVQMYLLAHRNDDLAGPYQVALYRVEVDGKVFEYRLGDEDSFWWRSSLRLSPDQNRIEIRSIGQLVAEYWINDKTVRNVPDDGRHNYGWVRGTNILKQLRVP